MTIKTLITRKFLETLSKAKLVSIIREMESHLVSMANANDEMSWRGPSDHQAICQARNKSYNDTTVHLRTLVGGGI